MPRPNMQRVLEDHKERIENGFYEVQEKEYQEHREVIKSDKEQLIRIAKRIRQSLEVVYKLFEDKEIWMNVSEVRDALVKFNPLLCEEDIDGNSMFFIRGELCAALDFSSGTGGKPFIDEGSHIIDLFTALNFERGGLEGLKLIANADQDGNNTEFGKLLKEQLSEVKSQDIKDIIQALGQKKEKHELIDLLINGYLVEGEERIAALQKSSLGKNKISFGAGGNTGLFIGPGSQTVMQDTVTYYSLRSANELRQEEPKTTSYKERR